MNNQQRATTASSGQGLVYKPDWEETKQRYSAWWRGEKLDRCLLAVCAPRDEAPPDEYPDTPPTIEQRWMDLAYLDARNEYEWRHTFYGAEAVPQWCPGYPGHVSMPTFYGCPIELDWDTGWHGAILTGEKLDVSGLSINRTGRWWQFGLEVHRHARQAAAGKALPGLCAIMGGGDTLSSLRGAERLLMDLMDDPSGVREAEIKLMHDWFKVYRMYADLLRAGDDWFTTWFPVWTPGYYYTAQCDVSYGISPKSFRECFLPAIQLQTDLLDYSLYHVDGIGAFPFVDDLCKLERLGGLQILPGAGKPSPLHYLDVLRKVQRAGKRLHISIEPQEVPQALELLSSRGLCIGTWCGSEKEALTVIEQASRLSVDRT